MLQLDDNIVALSFARDTKAGLEIPRKNRRMATHADLICAIALSTNARMAGGSLSSIPAVDLRIARTGFCYSLFVERVGEGREHWYGPFEDDITHAYQYGTRHDGAVPAIAPLLLYKKEFKSTSGMRSNYNHKRALQLQRIFPETAKINVRRAKSCGAGGPRIFHTMLADAIRNPLVVKDHELYQKITNRLQELCEEWAALNRKYNREKMQRRVEKLMN